MFLPGLWPCDTPSATTSITYLDKVSGVFAGREFATSPHENGSRSGSTDHLSVSNGLSWSKLERLTQCETEAM